jgi:hypothetical protein
MNDVENMSEFEHEVRFVADQVYSHAAGLAELPQFAE